MGCDIHIKVETRESKDSNWKIFNKQIFKSVYSNEETSCPYDGTNYNLFSILANVRNGYGFAGIKTGEGFVPISEPKGIPKDSSEEYKRFVKSYGSDGHSHSFLTLKELLNYDWNQLTFLRGIISFKEFKTLKEKNQKPTNWCSDISGPGIVKLEENEADEFLNEIPKEFKDKKLYVNYHWSVSYTECVEHFFNNTIEKLKTLGQEENVRIVFFFDN